MGKRPKVRIEPALLKKIRSFGVLVKGGVRQERCGVLVRGEHLRLHEMPNIHPNPVRHFAMANKDVEHVLDVYELYGVFHTHIEPEDDEPSEHDYMMLRQLISKVGNPDLIGMVYVVPLGLLIEYSGYEILRRRLIKDRKAQAL